NTIESNGRKDRTLYEVVKGGTLMLYAGVDISSESFDVCFYLPEKKKMKSMKYKQEEREKRERERCENSRFLVSGANSRRSFSALTSNKQRTTNNRSC
ncbi:MAG: hypothetical protein QM447_01755, partial [Thermotogota bacterium]|nr:hypothetical protein [Thermotogota bacterium]